MISGARDTKPSDELLDRVQFYEQTLLVLRNKSRNAAQDTKEKWKSEIKRMERRIEWIQQLINSSEPGLIHVSH